MLFSNRRARARQLTAIGTALALAGSIAGPSPLMAADSVVRTETRAVTAASTAALHAAVTIAARALGTAAAEAGATAANTVASAARAATKANADVAQGVTGSARGALRMTPKTATASAPRVAVKKTAARTATIASTTTRRVSWRTARYSWYGPGFYGNRTACGRKLTTTLVGVAHRTLPCGTRVTFRNPKTGKTLVVPVVDRGPYVAGRLWDLTGGACRALGMCYTGVVFWRSR